MTLAATVLTQAQAVVPLFSNDLAGFIKILSILVVTVTLPGCALVVYFLQKGPASKLAEFETRMTSHETRIISDINGIGVRVTVVEDAATLMGERVAGLQRTIADSQRDILEAIRSSAVAQMSAIHKVDLDVARLQERNSLGDCMVSFGASIERAMVNAIKSARAVE